LIAGKNNDQWIADQGNGGINPATGAAYERLFWGQTKGISQCPECGCERYIVVDTKNPYSKAQEMQWGNTPYHFGFSGCIQYLAAQIRDIKIANLLKR
jgi:hypothetical protein